MAMRGAIFAGLLYPIAVCPMSALRASRFARETKDHRIDTPV